MPPTLLRPHALPTASPSSQLPRRPRGRAALALPGKLSLKPISLEPVSSADAQGPAKCSGGGGGGGGARASSPTSPIFDHLPPPGLPAPPPLTLGAAACSGAPSPPSAAPKPSLVLLDWDDTLLPTSWLRKHGYIRGERAAISPPAAGGEHAALLARLEREVVTLLGAVASQSDAVAVITAAQGGWVEASCAAFMPRAQEALEALGIQVVAARPPARGESSEDEDGEDGERSQGVNPARWKAEAFFDQIEAARAAASLRPDSAAGACSLNIVSVGDSSWERTAAHASAREGDTVKTVKLCSQPSAAFLASELRALHARFTSISSLRDTRDIDVTEWGRRKKR